MADEFDVVIIGAGPAGENVADRAVRGGLTAAIVEAKLAGGECSYWACIPSKALLRPMDLMGEVGRMPGLTLGPVDVAAVLARRDEAVSHFDDGGQVEWIKSVPAEFVRGRGRLDGPKRVAGHAPDGAHPAADRPARRRAGHRQPPGRPADARPGRGRARGRTTR